MRDRSSAKSLSCVDTYIALKEHSSRASMNARHLIMCMIPFALLVLDCKAATTT